MTCKTLQKSTTIAAEKSPAQKATTWQPWTQPETAISWASGCWWKRREIQKKHKKIEVSATQSVPLNVPEIKLWTSSNNLGEEGCLDSNEDLDKNGYECDIREGSFCYFIGDC